MRFIPKAKLIEEHFMVQEVVGVVLSHWAEKASRQLNWLGGLHPASPNFSPDYVQFRRGQIHKQREGRFGSVFFGIADGLAWNPNIGGFAFTAREICWHGSALRNAHLLTTLYVSMEMESSNGIRLEKMGFYYELRRHLPTPVDSGGVWSVDKVQFSDENALTFLKRDETLRVEPAIGTS